MDRCHLGDHRSGPLPSDGLSDTGPETLRRISRMCAFNAWVMDLVRPHLHGRVFEIGCGQGNITELLLGEAVSALVALDVSPDHVEHVRRRWQHLPHFQGVCADVLDAADTVICLNVLEHIEEDVAALAAMRQLLAEGGRLVLLVPALRGLYGSLDVGLGHHRRYTGEELRAKTTEAGLRLLECRYFGLAGVLGWFVNSRVLRRPILPARQLLLYDRLVPLLRVIERLTGSPVGQSLFCVAESAQPDDSALLRSVGLSTDGRAR